MGSDWYTNFPALMSASAIDCDLVTCTPSSSRLPRGRVAIITSVIAALFAPENEKSSSVRVSGASSFTCAVVAPE